MTDNWLPPNATRVAACSCPYCGSKLDAASGLDEAAKPKPGCLSVCIECAEICVFNEQLALEKPEHGTLEEVFAADPDFGREVHALQSRVRTRLNPPVMIANPAEVLAALRSGDVLVLTQGQGWSLAKAGALVPDMTVFILRFPESFGTFGPDGLVPAIDHQGGSLVPHGDGLPGFGGSQTFVWVEAGNRTLH